MRHDGQEGAIDLKPTRFLCAALIPLCALALSLLWLQGSVSAALPGARSERPTRASMQS